MGKGLIFENETMEINIDLKKALGYLDCEQIIIYNLRKHVNNKVANYNLEKYIKKLLHYFEDKQVINRGNDQCTNYKYAAGFIATIIATPYWQGCLKAK